MLRQNSYSSSCINWQLLLVGLFFIIMQCDARAVNVSNTWTMPQEGLNVFYRFFRDRISWFEADAVCQFHHANLVTVDNSFQFDATRDLLRELDVNDIVWIGLMRPQSSDRFMWSNSRPLVADTGYWAESLPLMDAPLCAVIDPIRDYRWHALRCGGPETASFLCEMPVPSWADACNLKDMPNLTLQYMADTASIELIRNCQEEGLLRTMCRGKQDRERAMQDLICPRERLEAQRINDITNSHFKSLQIINSIPSDNNENNDIELLPMEVNYGPHYPSEELQTEKNTVQRLIEQFNVDELMQADEPSNMETISSFYKIPGLIPKPVKKSAKKVLDYPKKDNSKVKANMEQSQKDKKRLPLEMDEMMMGDQPMQGEPEMPEQILNEEVSNEILEPLPHIKKTNIHKEDGMEKMEKEAIAIKKSMQKTKEMENKKLMMMSTTTTTTTTTTSTTPEPTTTTKEPSTTVTSTTEQQPSTTTTLSSQTQKSDEVSKSSEDNRHKHHQDHHFAEDNTGATTSSSVISHPMHPQQPRSNVLAEESQHSHTKESVDSSHFIPPMLMVKSHYVPPTNKHEHHHHQHQQHAVEEQIHVESTTEREHDKQNQTSDMMVTTPKMLDLEKTTLKTLDSTTTKNENEEQQPQQEQIATTRQEEQIDIATETATTTESVSSSSLKPITEEEQEREEEYVKEKEQRKNSKNLHLEEITTTMTAATLQAQDPTTIKSRQDEVDSTLAPVKTTELEAQIIVATNSEEINKNNENSELKPTQKSDKETQTIAATKREEETTEKSLKSLDTTVEITEKVADSLEIATTPSEHQEQTTEEKPKATITTEESKKYLPLKETTQIHKETTNPAEDKTTEALTNDSNGQEKEQQETSATTIKSEAETVPATTTEKQYLQLKEKDQEDSKDKQNEENTEKDKTEAIVKTTEILESTSTSYSDVAAASTTAKAQEATENLREKEAATQTEKTTTTTIKPITITLPQNEVTTTETSVSSTNSEHSSTTISSSSTNPNINMVFTTTTTSPTTTTIATTTVTDTENEKESTITNNQHEISTTTESPSSSASSTPPETTRNFLKVTTEMPFKPNRRRSLTKPETVSYMKKILG